MLYHLRSLTMDRVHIVVLLLASLSASIALPVSEAPQLNVALNVPSVSVREERLTTGAQNTQTIVRPNKLPAVELGITSAAVVRPNKLPATVMGSEINSSPNLQSVSTTVTPLSTAVPPPRSSSNNNQAVQTPVLLPHGVVNPISAQVNNKPAAHAPVTLPAQLSSNSQANNAAMSTKPAIHVPVALPGQVVNTDKKQSVTVGTQPSGPHDLVDPIKRPANTNNNAVLNAKPAIHTPVTLPGQVINTDKKQSVTVGTQPSGPHDLVDPIKRPASTNNNAVLNAKPAIHTPVTLPAQVNLNNKKENINSPLNDRTQTTQDLVDPIKKTGNMALNAKPAIHTPVTLPAQVNLNKKDNIKAPLSVGTQPIHTPVTLPAAQIAPNKNPNGNAALNAKPAVQTPVLLPHGTVDPNKKIGVNSASNVKPAVHTPTTLPAQLGSNNKETVNTPSSKPAIQTPVLLPHGTVDPNKKIGVNSGSNMKPAVHTRTTLPAQLASNNKETVNTPSSKPAIQTPVLLPHGTVDPNKKIGVNSASNVKPAVHTPTTLPAQLASNNKDTVNSKPVVHTPVTLPAQTTSNNNKGNANAALSAKPAPAIHNPVTLLPHKDSNTYVATATHTPQTLPAQINSNKKDSSISAQHSKPAAASQVSSDIKGGLPTSISHSSVKQVAMVSEAGPGRFSADTRPAISLNLGVEATPMLTQISLRSKRQYLPIMTLPARVPAGGFQSNRFGSFNGAGYNQGGYQGIQPVPAIVNRPAGGHLRGAPIYYSG